jgi:hypothetical protein
MQRYAQSTQLSYPRKNDSAYRKRGDLYPTARMESLPALRGTRAWIVVPALDCDSYGKRSVQHLQRLLHADEAKPPACLCCFAAKACAGVPDREMNLLLQSSSVIA